MERNLVRERTRAAMQEKRHRGEFVGQVPYGRRLASDGVHLVDDLEEVAIIGMIVNFRALGFSLQGIADHLNDNHVPARGKRWHKTTVSRILTAHRPLRPRSPAMARPKSLERTITLRLSERLLDRVLALEQPLAEDPELAPRGRSPSRTSFGYACFTA